MHETERGIGIGFSASEAFERILISNHADSYIVVKHTSGPESKKLGVYPIPFGPRFLSVLDLLNNACKNGELLSFYSVVTVEGKICHVPMIDFAGYESITPVSTVKKILTALGEREGIILRSGRSYHYYGFKLKSEEEWLEFMENCRKYPEIGSKYIDLQIRDGGCTLRFTTNDDKPVVPTVIDFI